MEHNQFEPEKNPQMQSEEETPSAVVENTAEPSVEEPGDQVPQQPDNAWEAESDDSQNNEPESDPAPANAWYSYPGRQQPSFYAPPPFEPMPQPPADNKKGLRIFAIILAMVILFIGGVCAGYFTGSHSMGVQTPTDGYWASPNGSSVQNAGDGKTSSFDITTGTKPDQPSAYEQIIKKVSPSIVNITIYAPDGSKGSYASGIIMDAAKGYVLTNDHIYSQVPNAKFLITLNNGTEFKAEFVSGDSRNDIAILKIENPKNLTAAEFNVDKLSVGESVLAIGQSYGYADTVSEGIVSAVDRRVSLSGGAYSERYIQTTAAINPGNSGGALVNMYGQVVGVTSAKISSQDVEGLGFAIPSERVLDIVTNLQKNGKVVGRAKLGITYIELDSVRAEVNGTPTGLLIQEITQDSGLVGKGFNKGDIITQVNGKAITIASVLLDIIEDAKAGDEITLGIYKADTKKTKTVKVKLAEAESTNSYKTSNGSNRVPQSSEETGNDLPVDPYEYFKNR